MCTNPVDHEAWSDEEWEAAVAETGAALRRSHWGRFMRLYGDEADPGPQRPLTDVELLSRLADAEALTTQLMALQAQHLLELRERRLAEQAAEHTDHSPGRCTRGCCDPDGWVGLEVAQALAVTENQVGRRIDTADRLSRYDTVREAVQDGLLQAWTATKLLEHLDALAPHVSPDRLERVERVVVAWLLDRPRTTGQLDARMRRLLAQARSQDGTDDAEAPSAGRYVRVMPADGCGLATLVARLPEADAIALATTVQALSADPVDEGDTRTREQREADVLVACVTGLRPVHGRADDLELTGRPPGSLSVRLDVTIPADALVGAGDTPAEIPGYGPVPASTGRAVAELGTTRTVRPIVYDPASGRLLGAGGEAGGPRIAWLPELTEARGYEHPPVMERLVALRDGTCRAPGCSRRAQRCDCDHVVPWPEGPTSVENTCCLCRRHHRLKTHAPGWRLEMGTDGTAAWTTPTGRTLTTDPADYSPEPGGEAEQDEPPF